jgi:hypothetical protein
MLESIKMEIHHKNKIENVQHTERINYCVGNFRL